MTPSWASLPSSTFRSVASPMARSRPPQQSYTSCRTSHARPSAASEEVQISRERRVEKEEKNEMWHRVERSSGKFQRSFRLPENAKMDQIKAAMENGVLTVIVPKAEVKKPNVKAIQISG